MIRSDPQIELWNGPSGDRWAEFLTLTDRAFGVFGEVALERLDGQLGERILDVGCGAGTSLLRLAEDVGPTGAVLGIDASAPLVETAAERCAGLAHASVVCDDAATADLRGAWDAVYCSFGAMFFANPVAGLSNMRAALRPGGRMVLTCWQDASHNHWCSRLLDVTLPLVDEARDVLAPRTPGTFAFADADYVMELLTAAGFQNIAIEDSSLPVSMGRSAQDAVDFAMSIGPVASLTEKQTPEIQLQIKARLADLFAESEADGEVTLPGAAWIVSATALQQPRP